MARMLMTFVTEQKQETNKKNHTDMILLKR